MDLNIGLCYINCSWRFNYEVGKVGSIEGDEGEDDRVDDSPFLTQVGERNRAGVHLIEIVRPPRVHGLDRALDNGPTACFFVANLRLRDDGGKCVGRLADRLVVVVEVPGIGRFHEVEFVSSEHPVIGDDFPIVLIQVRLAAVDDAEMWPEDR